MYITKSVIALGIKNTSGSKEYSRLDSYRMTNFVDNFFSLIQS